MKKNTLIGLVLMSLAALVLVSCGGGGGTGTAGAGAGVLQYTPNQANWATFYIKPMVGGTNTSHAPDGVGWLTQASWQNAQWNGVA